MENIYTYTDFVKLSSELLRQDKKLPNEVINIIHSIKRQLNIEIDNTFERKKLECIKIVKNDENLCKLYKQLNKITTKTYDKLSVEVINMVKEFEESQQQVQKEVCNKLFEIITTNDLFCELYAKLYNELIKVSPLFKSELTEQINNYLETIKEIKYVSSNEDYDLYCEYIKHINKIKNFTMFIIMCYKQDICKLEQIKEILFYFQKKIIDQIDEKNKLYENECYANNIYLIIKECLEILYHDSDWEVIERNLLFIKDTNGEGKNMKIKFKIMDINDIINKLKK